METAGSVYTIKIRISHGQLVCISDVSPAGVEVWGENPLRPMALSIMYITLVSRSPRSRGWLRDIVPSEDTSLDQFNIEVVNIYVVIVNC